MKHVALLRGINVGGRHKLPMRELVPMFEEAGAGDVRTYIQSGNVVFDAPAARALRVATTVGRTIAAEHGFDVPVVVRSGREWKAVVSANPFLKRGVDLVHLHVLFLAARPAAAAARALDPDRSPGDRFAWIGRDLFLHLPHGVARTKLTHVYLERTLGTAGTARNWKTVMALAAML